MGTSPPGEARCGCPGLLQPLRSRSGYGGPRRGLPEWAHRGRGQAPGALVGVTGGHAVSASG